jgi:hypothetical protein
MGYCSREEKDVGVAGSKTKQNHQQAWSPAYQKGHWREQDQKQSELEE